MRKQDCLYRVASVVSLAVLSGLPVGAFATTTVTHPYQGITSITRTETVPRALTMHIVQVDLTAPGISFELTAPGGTRDTVRQTTLDFMNAKNAEVAVNSHFFVPYPTTDTDANVVGLAASKGTVYSPFEDQPVATGFAVQNYAIVPFGAAMNIDATNHASIVHRDVSNADNKHVLEPVTLYNAISGSAQIVTDGVSSVPVYSDATHPTGLLTTNGTYNNSNSWYDVLNPRTSIGISQDGKTLTIFTVDKAGTSLGMKGSEVASLLISDYGVYNALNMDGGGSTTLAMRDPVTQVGSIVNTSSDNPLGRAVGSSLAIYAVVPEPGSIAVLVLGGLCLRLRRRA